MLGRPPSCSGAAKESKSRGGEVRIGKGPNKHVGSQSSANFHG